MRVSPDGRYAPQVIVAVTQSTQIPADAKAAVPSHTFRGGSTLVVDLSVPEVKYRIVKRITSESRRARTAAFVREAAADPLRALFFGPDRKEPFAALHSLADDVR
jgi:ABC-type transporter Mla subunit MlaD